MCSILLLLLLLLLGLRQETHPSFYKRKTHDLQVICSGRTFSISLWYKGKVCIRRLSKIRLDKQIGMYVKLRDNEVHFEAKVDRNRARCVPF